MIWMYAGFVALVLVLLALDLGVFHRRAHVVSVREALGWSAFWIALGLAFAGFIYAGYENHWLGLGADPRPDDRRPAGGRGRGHRLQRRRERRGQVPHRLPGREVAGRRQHLRDRDALRLLRRARDLPAPRALLGHPGRPGDAGRHDRGGRPAHPALHLDHLRLRRLPDPHRDQDAAPEDGRDRPQPERRGPPDPAALPDHRALPRPALLRPRRLGRLARGARPRGGRGGGPRSSTRPGRAFSSPPRSSWPW